MAAADRVVVTIISTRDVRVAGSTATRDAA
jgi:hypothetical protein